MPSLLDRAPRSIEPHELVAFLEERHLESERLDYKLALDRSIADTLVAMANSDGGLIIVGVVEKNQAPVSWPGLGGKDWVDTLGNHIALESNPPVRYEPAVIQLPENSGKPLLLIRVPPALRKPHMTHSSGILVRVGSQDRRPTLEQIDAWFRMRQSPVGSTRIRGQIPYFFVPGTNTGDEALHLSVLAQPVLDVVPLPMSETTDARVGQLLATIVPGRWGPLRKSVEHIEFQTPDGGKAYVHANGFAVVRASWLVKRVPMDLFLAALGRTLCFQLQLFRQVFSYADDISVRLSVTNLQYIDFEWTPSSTLTLDRLAPPGSGVMLDYTLTGADDIEGIAADWAIKVCREAQLIGYERQVIGIIALLKDISSPFKC